jgi:FkbM family methyltransferase
MNAQHFRNLIRQNRNLGIMKPIEKFARNFLVGYWNQDCSDMVKNGELYLINQLRKNISEEKITVFDVGANRGEWSLMVKKIFPNALIHCFEIIPQTFNLLSSTLESYGNIFLNNFGLSDSHKQVSVTYFPQGDTISSIQSLPWELGSEIIKCNVITGDDYIKRREINKIDLIKIDIEGHDFFALKGFSEFLTTKSISVIQFEYGCTCIPSRITLGDFYDFLIPKGYSIGRLYPMGVDFKEYELFHDENFRMGNYVAVHKSMDYMIESLSI